MHIDHLTINEAMWAIRKLKRQKAPGPDQVPIGFFKDTDREQLDMFLQLLDSWWNGEQMPTEATQAQVTFLFKKGDKANLNNYRPMWLLSSIYKIPTAD